MKRIKWQSGVELEIRGYNIERAINVLSAGGVEFFEIEKKDAKNIRVQFKGKYSQKVKKYLKEHKFEIKSEKFLGFSRALNFFKIRWGIVLGAVCAAILFIFMNSFLLGVKVEGTSSEIKDQIVEVLAENGIEVMCPLGSIETEVVEKIILDNFENVSLVSAVKKGSSILISIKEKFKGENFEGLTPLLATQNGMITKINLIQGTALVKVGDIVRVGDPLVAPYTFDASGKKIPVEAKAEIVADIWITGESEHSEVQTKMERTGNFVKFRESAFLGKTIFSNKGTIPFENYETVKKESYLTEFIFPIKYTEIFYFETKCDIIEIAFKDVETEKIAEAKQNAYVQVADISKIKSEEYSISEKGGKWVVVYTITLSGDIAV